MICSTACHPATDDMPPPPVSTGRPRFDIAEIVRQHRDELEATTSLGSEQRRVLSAIAQCRTASLGVHVDRCQSCGFERPAYNSCRNRHCPKCQALAQEEWIEARAERLLPVRHFHVVFTLPCELRGLAKAHRKEVFGALFGSASETLQDLSQSRFGGTLGATMVLHTWTRDLNFHPHLHAIVTAGALSSDGQRWVNSGKKYLFPVQIMGTLLRAKMLERLHLLRRDGELGTGGDLERILSAAAAKKFWHVYVKPPFKKVEHVTKYLGRYTHRVGLSNSRLVAVTQDEVVFTTKGGKQARLTPVEFLRRFVQHVLPPGFLKIRHYGLYAAANVARKSPFAREILTRKARPAAPTARVAVVPIEDWRERLRRLTGRDVSVCPLCGGPMVSVDLPIPAARGPPRVARCL